MGNVQFLGEKVLFTAAYKVAMDPDCCCGGEYYDCPDDCSGCPTDYTLTVTGWTGQWSVYNGTYPIERMPNAGFGSCYWFHAEPMSNPLVEILCTDGNWQMNLFDLEGGTPMAIALESVDDPDDCPPTGTWTFYDIFNNPIGTGELTTP